MSRKIELLNLLNNDIKLTPLVDDILFMETQLSYLRSLPQIKVNPNDPNMQKATPASKQYKEILQQYTNCIKILMKATGTDIDDEESPLREWMKKNGDMEFR